MERETGLEPATFSLARRRSTTELLPLAFITHSTRVRPGYLGTHYTQVTVCGRTETRLTRGPRATRPSPRSHPLPGSPLRSPTSVTRSDTALEMGIRPPYNTVAIRRLLQRAHVAQVAERVLGKDKVTGSNPVVGSMNHSLRAGSWRRHVVEVSPSGSCPEPKRSAWFRTGVWRDS